MFRACLSLVAVSCLVLVASCGEDQKFVYECSCTASCTVNGNTNTATENDTACVTEAEAQKAVSDAIAGCSAELEPNCDDYNCECSCPKTTETCEG